MPLTLLFISVDNSGFHETDMYLITTIFVICLDAANQTGEQFFITTLLFLRDFLCVVILRKFLCAVCSDTCRSQDSITPFP